MARGAVAGLRARGHEVSVLAAPSGGGARLDPPPDVVHAFDLAPTAFAEHSLELAREHGSAFAVTPSSTADVWSDRDAGMAVCRAADVVFVLTRAETAALVAGGVDARLIEGVGQGAWLPGAADPAGFRARHGLDDRPVVLYLGRKTAFKGYRRLLAAVPGVLDAVPDATFVFAGPNVDPDSAAAFRNVADGHVLDLGVIDEREKHSALAACDVFCLPTTADILPLAFLEAWCCGKPVVSGTFDGVGEIVRHGENGLVVADEPSELTGALVRLLQDRELRIRLGEAGRADAGARHGWEAIAERYESGYDVVARALA